MAEKQRLRIGTAVYRADGADRFVLLEGDMVLRESREEERLKHRLLAIFEVWILPLVTDVRKLQNNKRVEGRAPS